MTTFTVATIIKAASAASSNNQYISNLITISNAIFISIKTS